MNPNVEFSVARTVVPPDGYTRNPRRHEVPTALLVMYYGEFLIGLPPAERSAHLQRMLFQRPRLASGAVEMLSNRAHAHGRMMQRYRLDDQQWALDAEAQVAFAIQWRFTIVLDANGVAYPPPGIGPLRPRPVAPAPLG